MCDRPGRWCISRATSMPQNTSNPASPCGALELILDNSVVLPHREQTKPGRERWQPRYGRHPDFGQCPYQRSQTSDDTGDSTSENEHSGSCSDSVEGWFN
jgi:hypothetical protein